MKGIVYEILKPKTRKMEKVCKQLNAWTLRELSKHTESDILSCQGIGRTTLNHIKDMLAKHGLTFRPEHPGPTTVEVYTSSPMMETRKNKDALFRNREKLLSFISLLIKYAYSPSSHNYLMPKIEKMELAEINKLLGRAFTDMRTMEVLILILRHHFNMTLEDVGIALELTKQRNRQKEAKAFRKLRHSKRRNVFFNI